MVNRFLAGYHAAYGRYGIWLSRPGYDVTAAGPRGNYILHSDVKTEQCIMSGIVGLSPNTTQTVPLSVTIGKRPYVALHGSQNGNNQYPHDLGLVGATTQTEIYCSCRVYDDRIIFTNTNTSAAPYNLYVTFLVFYRSITG